MITTIIGRKGLIGADYVPFTTVFNSIGSSLNNTIFWLLLSPFYTVILAIALLPSNFTSYTNEIWVITPIYWLIFLVWLILLGRFKLLNGAYFALIAITSTLFTFAIYRYGISRGLYFLLPDSADIRSELWLLFIIFMIATITKYGDNGNVEMKGYILNKLQKFKSEYEKELNGLTDFEKNILLAIMIYEDFQRPRFIRTIERALKRKSTGIMQVLSEKPLEDKESIRVSIVLIKKIIKKIEKETHCEPSSYEVAKEYNGSDFVAEKVSEIYYKIN